MSEELVQKQKRMARWVFSHMLGLGWVNSEPVEGYPQGKPYYASGFVLSVAGHWFWVTAGHVIEWIQDDLQKGVRLTEWHLHDTEVAAPGDVVTFAWRDDRAFGFDIDGADYGVVYLSPYYRNLLEKRNIVAFDERAWLKGLPEEFDHYLLLGIPGETVAFAEGGLGIEIQKLAIGVEKVAGLPEGVTPSQLPRFYGRLLELGALESIKGMSGGPILGFKDMPDGQTKYWLVALQSRWVKSDRVIVGCPVRFFAKWIAEEVVPHISAG